MVKPKKHKHKWSSNKYLAHCTVKNCRFYKKINTGEIFDAAKIDWTKPITKKLKATIPREIAAYLDLNVKEKLTWKMETIRGRRVAIVWIERRGSGKF